MCGLITIAIGIFLFYKLVTRESAVLSIPSLAISSIGSLVILFGSFMVAGTVCH